MFNQTSLTSPMTENRVPSSQIRQERARSQNYTSRGILVRWAGYHHTWEPWRVTGAVGDPVETWEPEVTVRNTEAPGWWCGRAMVQRNPPG